MNIREALAGKQASDAGAAASLTYLHREIEPDHPVDAGY
jgi:hypothetical protein